jgi:hypothetical protein
MPAADLLEMTIAISAFNDFELIASISASMSVPRVEPMMPSRIGLFSPL